jgi:endonuclease/exonuclease/phosphatase (EEP) superfamily protein YafD
MRQALTILTCNLWNRGARPEALGAALARLDPDVVVCQELVRPTAEVIARALPHGRLDPRDDMHGMGIATRWPVTVERIALPRRDAHIARLVPGAWPGLAASIEVMNLHLSAPSHWRAFAERRAQIERLERHLTEHPGHRVVAGDFNSFPGMGVYNRLRAVLRDAVAEHARQHGRPPQRTWGPTAESRRLARIDHVMTTGLSPRVVETVHIEGSDHRALFVALTMD